MNVIIAIIALAAVIYAITTHFYYARRVAIALVESEERDHATSRRMYEEGWKDGIGYEQWSKELVTTEIFPREEG